MARTKHVRPFLLQGASIQVIDEVMDDNVLIYTIGDTYATGDIMRRVDDMMYYVVLADGVVDETNFEDMTDRYTVTDASSASFFTQLRDTPSAYGGHAEKLVVVKADESGLEFVDKPTTDTSFTDLTDTPADYVGKENQIVVVNPTADGLIFSTFDPVSGVVSVNGMTGVVVLGAGDVDARPDTWIPTYAEVLDKPAEFPPSAHTHTEYYTKAEVDALLADKAAIGHTHSEYAPLTGAAFTGSISVTGDITNTGTLTTDGNIASKADVIGYLGTMSQVNFSFNK